MSNPGGLSPLIEPMGVWQVGGCDCKACSSTFASWHACVSESVFFYRDECMQVAQVIRSIGPEFAAYGDEIERQQIEGGMLTSLSFEDLNSLLVCPHSHIL
jgi:hypothetical protein